MRSFALLLVFLSTAQSQFSPYENDEEPKTKSLSGAVATDGDPNANAVVLELLVNGYVKQLNDRVYLEQQRRNFWLGTRYYSLDSPFFLETRDTCAYRMNSTERNAGRWSHDDGTPIWNLIYQCQRQEHCCGLRCCENSAITSEEDMGSHNSSHGSAISTVPCLLVIVKMLF